MNTKIKLMTLVILLIGAFTTALIPVSGQDEFPYSIVLTLHMSAAPTEPPSLDAIGDGRFVFKVNPVGTVTGDLEGAFSQHITQIDPCPTCKAEPSQLSPIAAFFTIETDDGTLEGYYTGAFYGADEGFPDQLINVHGQILSVTAAYDDLYLADVYYDGVVDFEEVDGSLIGLGDSGTIIIVPR